MYYRARTADSIASGQPADARRKQRAPGWRCVCTYQMASLFCLKWRLENLTFRSSTPTIDEYLLEEKYPQISCRSGQGTTKS